MPAPRTACYPRFVLPLSAPSGFEAVAGDVLVATTKQDCRDSSNHWSTAIHRGRAACLLTPGGVTCGVMVSAGCRPRAHPTCLRRSAPGRPDRAPRSEGTARRRRRGRAYTVVGREQDALHADHLDRPPQVALAVDTDRGYAIVHPNDVAHGYVDSTVPGEFRRPTDALGDQLAVTLTQILAHSDSQQGAGR